MVGPIIAKNFCIKKQNKKILRHSYKKNRIQNIFYTFQKMLRKIKHCLFLLTLIQFACLIAVDCQSNSTDGTKIGKMDFNQQIMRYLSTFQAKLESKTLTKIDEQVIVFLLNLIMQRTREIEKEKEDRTVYWYSRQGRK